MTVNQLVKAGHYEQAIQRIIELAEPSSGDTIYGPVEAYKTMLPYVPRRQESMWVLTLNGAHALINIHEVSRGLVNKTLVHPREVFRVAIEDNAAAIMLVHNHPSGKTEPSMDDVSITQRIHAAGEIIGISVLDHMVIATQGYYSFLEHGRMPCSQM